MELEQLINKIRIVLHNHLEIQKLVDVMNEIRDALRETENKGDFDEKTKKLIDYLLEKEKEGKVCIMTIEGILEANLDDFIKQPTEGLLYDLNRDRATTLTWIDNNSPKWINDFAVCLVITKLKALLSDQLP